MAVYTDVGFDDLKVVLADYDVGIPQSFKGIAEGIENSNFLLQTERGKYILTLYEKRVDSADLPFFLGLLEYLSGRGIACPLPVRSRDGRQSIRVKGRRAALLTFLDGLSLDQPRVEHCAAAGAALADLHNAARGFPVARKNNFSLEGWQRIADAIIARADRVQDGLAVLIETTLASLDADWPMDLPIGIIHADLFPDNVLFLRDRVSGLIDFYFACTDLLAYDVAVMLNAWCFDPGACFNRARAQSLIAAYEKTRTLTQREISALPVLARGAALRFLLTRLQDWIDRDPAARVPAKDPLEFASRLRFHANIDTPAEYGL
ncbi:MAG TPA: homoserine kinase [Rhizomicrobium sp.]|jgi:homoserine kinase type II